jgi:hypothetical protein
MNRQVVLVLGFALAVASRSQAQPSAECRALQESLGTDSSTGFTGVSLNRYGSASFFGYGVLQRSVPEKKPAPLEFVQKWMTRRPVEQWFADRGSFIEAEPSREIQSFNVSQADLIDLEINFAGSSHAMVGGLPPGTPSVTIILRSWNDAVVTFTPTCDAKHHMIAGADSGGTKYILYIRSKPWPLLVLSEHD